MGKYFKYAIGEIVLVMIGILLALQVNNWNENRKRHQEVDQLLTDIEQDLIANYHQANIALEFYRYQDSLARLIAHKKLTKKNYDENFKLSYYVANWEYYIPAVKNINQFVEAEKIIEKRFKPILNVAKNLQLYKSVLDDAWSNLDDNINKNIESIAQRGWLIKGDSIAYRKRLEYHLNSKEYPIEVFGYWARSQNYHDKISRYRAQTIALLTSIKLINENYSTKEVMALYDSLNMPAALVYDCQMAHDQLQPLRKLRSSALYGNLSDDEVSVSATNFEGEEIIEFKILPKSFMSIPASGYFGFDGDNNVLIEIKDVNGNCIEKYGMPENGYLLIE